MEQRDLGYVLIPFVALLAVFGSGAVPSEGTDAPQAAAADGETHAKHVPPHTAMDLLRVFHGDPLIQPPPRAERCVIATVPDPIDAANVNYTYDRYVEAIQRAMEAAGYVLDRFDLPWLDEDAVKEGRRADGDPRFRREPGRILFRSRTAAADQTRTAAADQTRTAETAVVFLVGETPTAGIHKRAFETALQELDLSCETPPKDTRVRVLGPSFSGSQVSLRMLVKRAARSFFIVTGSATAVDAGALRSASTGTEFKATIESDAAARSAFLTSVAARECERTVEGLRRLVGGAERPIKVAMLIEANTVFGRGLIKPNGETTSQTSCGTIASSGETIELIQLPFPLHISSLRAAARDTGAKPRDPAEAGAEGLTEMNLRDFAEARTTIPLTSRLENPSAEIVLTTMLEDLERKQVKYIGLMATDVRDRIFLAQRVHHHIPNGVIFTFSADLLYAHPDVNLDLRGTQVVASYPLFAANQDWSPGSGNARLLFPAHTAQGVYNAALALLEKHDLMREYGQPLGGRGQPPLWLSIVGRNGLHPVRLLAGSGSDMVERDPPADAQLTVRIVSHPWVPTAALLVCLLPAMFAWRQFAPRVPGALRDRFNSGPLAELFGGAIFSQHRLARMLYVFACWSALTSAYLLTAAMFLLPPLTHGAGSGSSGTTFELNEFSFTFNVVLLAGGFVMLSTLALLAWRVWEESGNHRGRGVIPRLARVSLGGGCLVLVALSSWVVYRWLSLPNSQPIESLLLYMRSSDFTTGVSPLVPLLLVCSAGAAWAVSSLRRLRLKEGLDEFSSSMPSGRSAAGSFLGLDGPSFEGIACLEGRVVDAVSRESTRLPWPILTGVLGFLLIAWMRLFGPDAVPTIEGPAFDGLFALGFLAVYTGLGLAFLRFVFIWRRLVHLLRRLACHPTVKAYARLRTAIPGKPKVSLTSSSQVFTALEFSVDRAGELAALGRELVRRQQVKGAPQGARLAAGALAGVGESLPIAPAQASAPDEMPGTLTARLRAELPRLEQYVSAAESSLHLALDAEATGDWREKVIQRTAAEQQLSEMTRVITTLVRPAWRLPADGAPQRTKDDPNEVQWFERAEDFLTSRVAAFLSHIVPQLQNLIVFVTAGLLLMLIAVTSYPFDPRQLLLLFNTTVILAIVTATLVVFVQMERDTILSVLSDTPPGHVSWNAQFLSRIAVYVALPLVSLMGAQFPETAQKWISWVTGFLGSH